MKWILENGTKVIGLLSFSLIVFTTVHDWGYFSIIGPNFRTLLSAYDYITNAIEWMPAFFFSFGVTTALAFALSSWTDQIPEGGYGDHKRKQFRRKMATYSGMVLIASLFFLGKSMVQTFPASRVTQIGAAALFFTTLSVFYLAWKDTKLKIRRQIALAMGAAGLACSAYISGVEEARSAIEQPANVYKLNLKGNFTKSAVLLRTFEKGVLIWNSDSSTAQLLRWDQIDGLSHIVAFDKVSRACRMFSWFCQPQVQP
jgi:hypothetical protein